MLESVEQAPEPRGLPLWVPFIGLVGALAFAVYIGVQVAPTLMGLVLPPEPPVPTDNVQLLEQSSRGPGSDEWQYTSNLTGCEMAAYIDKRVGGCYYLGNSGCDPKRMVAREPDATYRVAICTPVQQAGQSSVRWHITILTGYPAPQPRTRLLVWRDVTNLAP
jgi:hypothetical protein